jgi:hypothetical protein
VRNFDDCGLEIRDTVPIQNREKPAPRDPSRAELFQCSRGDITRTLNNPKTYHRFFGTIFLGGVESVENPQLQPLAGQKIPENRKNTKKSVFFLERPPPFSCQTASFQGHFLLSNYCLICKLLTISYLQGLKNSAFLQKQAKSLEIGPNRGFDAFSHVEWAV